MYTADITGAVRCNAAYVFAEDTKIVHVFQTNLINFTAYKVAAHLHSNDCEISGLGT